MKYTCWGAAKQVTGSMHYLQLDSGYTILIDCGIDYEEKADEQVNVKFPFRPSDVDVVILTHAHIDHSGNIPNLIRQGFKGEVICTEPTAYLLDKLWTDSVNIMNSNAKRNRGKAKLFGYKDVKDATERLLTWPYYSTFDLADDAVFTFYEAGHILGAASVVLEVTEAGQKKRIGFTGDLGKKGSKLIVDPVIMEELDYLVAETTYGDRHHIEQRTPEQVLVERVKKTCVENGGNLVIPAFSVGRTQAILFTLKKLFESGQLPDVRVFSDSPLALASTNIHQRFTDYLNQEAKTYVEERGHLFEFKNLYIVEDEEDEEEMDHYREASIIVSSAGMLEGGRIQHHVSHNIQNPKNTVLIAGFCSPGTLGEQLLQGHSMLSIRGKQHYVYAEILQTDVFSAHPDAAGLTEYFTSTDHAGLKKVFFVHGEEESMEGLRQALGPMGKKVVIPERGEEFRLR